LTATTVDGPKPSFAGGTLRDDERDGRLTSPIIASMGFSSTSVCDSFGSAASAARRPTRLLHLLI
jgi:hypothetical protein